MALSDAEMLDRLQRTLDVGGNTHDVSDIIDALQSGRMQSFSRKDAFVVSEITCYPRKKRLNLLLACGDLDAVMALQPEIEVFGRSHGCEEMTMSGRKGWSRVLPKYGWSPEGIIYALPLKETDHG